MDPASIMELMEQNPDGARLVLRSDGGQVFGDVACSIGYRRGRPPVFAYLSVGGEPPFRTDLRFYVDRISRRGQAWIIECRNDGGIREIEVCALSESERRAVRGWIESLPSEVQEDLENAMRAMLDPRAL